MNGNLNALNQVRLLATRAGVRSEAIGVIQGTVPGEQGKGYLRLLARELIPQPRGAGYHTLRGTFIEHENVASSAYTGRLGRPAHGVTFYARNMYVSDLRDLRRLETQFFRAPSAHNTQPWILEYGPDRVELSFDTARALPASDPTRRDHAPVARRAGGSCAHRSLVGWHGGRVRARVRGRDTAGRHVPPSGGSPYATPFTPDDLARRQTSRAEYARH